MAASLLGDMPPDVPTGPALPAGTPWFPTSGVAAPGADAGSDYQEQVDADRFLRDRMLTPDVDQRSGAPFKVRAGVETQGDPGNRLAALQTYAPDAKPVPGTGNFIYTDPSSGKRTLYNPTSWGLGDVTRLEQPAASLLGGVAGGLGGAAVGGPAGGLVGGGAGMTAGSEALGAVGRGLLGTQDVRTPGQIAGEDVMQTGANIALPGILGAAGKAILPALKPVTAAAIALDKSGTTDGLVDNLTPGVATSNAGLQRADSAFAQTFGGGRIYNQYKGMRGKIEDGVGNVASDVAGPGNAVPDADTFAQTIYNVAQRADQNWQTRLGNLTNNLNSKVGNPQVDISPVTQLRDQLQAQWDNEGTATTSDYYKPAVTEMNKIIEDAGDSGTMPFSSLLKARTLAGNKTYGTAEGMVPPQGRQAMDTVYDKLRDVLGDAAQAQGPDAQAAWNDYNGGISAYRAPGGQGEAVAAMLNKNYNADILANLAKSTVREQQGQLAGFLGAADPADRPALLAGMINRLGIGPDNQFSTTTLANRWGAIPDANKTMLFAGNPDARTALDQLSTVANGIKTELGTAGHSNTGAILHLLETAGGAATAVAFGHPLIAAGSVAAQLGGPYAVGRALTSAPFTKWISGVMADNSTGAWGRAMGQLGAVGDADPSIRNLTARLQMQMAAAPQAQGSPPASQPQ